MRWPDRPPAGPALRVALIAVALVTACRTTGPGEGGPVDLRTEAPEYYRTIERRINGNWGRGRMGATERIAEEYNRSGGGIVVISFSIGKKGELLGEPSVEESSGSAFLDAEAVRAVTSAAPFPPLPDLIETHRVDLLWRFEHIPARGATR